MKKLAHILDTLKQHIPRRASTDFAKNLDDLALRIEKVLKEKTNDVLDQKKTLKAKEWTALLKMLSLATYSQPSDEKASNGSVRREDVLWLIDQLDEEWSENGTTPENLSRLQSLRKAFCLPTKNKTKEQP